MYIPPHLRRYFRPVEPATDEHPVLNHLGTILAYEDEFPTRPDAVAQREASVAKKASGECTLLIDSMGFAT